MKSSSTVAKSDECLSPRPAPVTPDAASTMTPAGSIRPCCTSGVRASEAAVT